MTDEELAAIRERAEKATPGPWFRDGPRALIANNQRIIAKVAHFNKSGSWEATMEDDANAKFIAHARTDISALLAEVERLRQALEDTERALMREQLSNQDIAELVDTDATRERDTLWSENAAMREIVQFVANGDMVIYRDDEMWCVFGCEGGIESSDEGTHYWGHTPDCPATKAQALLANERSEISETKDSNGDA